ncbi:MAG: hypothetical protein ACTSRC_20490 [Candidatus Helarchaeota archaeon]
MDLELWLMAISLALENKDSHVKFIYFPRKSYTCDAVLKDTETGEEDGVILYKTTKPVAEYENIKQLISSILKQKQAQATLADEMMYI